MKLPRSFEMTVTRAEFLRLLPAAVGGAVFVEEADAFRHSEPDRSWRIVFTPLPELRIGLVKLARHRVEFEFEGYAADEIDAFMVRFELYFRRGGG
ncbi:MAG: hypothetical protein D4S02_13590 [Rhodocyclaceae bacterium]|nr:MAG: hypothetical protein D4S02_13590 [Rhodocyclaceae bacterium]